MIFSFSINNRGSKFLDIEFIIENNKDSEIYVQLPAWRPGRYELANFAKNIQKFDVRTLNNKVLKFEKVSKDKWKIYAGKLNKLKIKYNYYANELNAGSTWVDENQTYVNPVNCCLYVEGREYEPIKLVFNKLNHKQTATSLKKNGDYYIAKSYDELADSPFILSDSIQSNSYEVKGTKFTLWFQGECRPPWLKIIRDFKKFTKEQLTVFGSFPFDEYHFFYQILPYKAYHGVEHQNNTVISFGPGYSIFDGENYEEFLGVSSHELFHAWNVKTIRPGDMTPYDYTKENYTKMGYLTEGATTYYGDLMLERSGVFTINQYLKQINKILDRHFLNYGTQNLSVVDSSFDTWLDGYEKGIPNRKGSIYIEGCILIFCVDLLIKSATKGKKSFDNLMKNLYSKYAKKGLGITEDIFCNELKSLAGKKVKDIWVQHAHTATNYLLLLKKAIKPTSFQLKKVNPDNYLQNRLGIYLQNETGKIVFIAPNSPGNLAGLNYNDEILAINNIKLMGNGNEWASYFSDKFILTIKKDGKIKDISISPSAMEFFTRYKLTVKG